MSRTWVPVLASVVTVAVLVVLLHHVAATTPADALARPFALLGVAACTLLAGVIAWWAGAQVRGTVAPPSVAAAPSLTNDERARLESALARERELGGHLAHELRTPLAVLRTGLELSLRRQTAGSDEHAHLRELLDTVDELRQLTDNLFTLARLDRSEGVVPVQQVPLRPLVDACWRRLESKAEQRGLRFANEVEPDAMVSGDRSMLQIVLQNLLTNAVSYTERGGAIAVSLRAGAIAVWDSGPQLTAEQLERVFDRMWRADAARTDAARHAGLGLALARGLCARMDMTLRAENLSEGGLQFVIASSAAARA
ncbi:MAG: HAMP domain-containing histidine kinase [Nannocystaceae bacterium]|nr:HAMP domain-containing histidine kinase [Nannocystaceae bacterium]